MCLRKSNPFFKASLKIVVGIGGDTISPRERLVPFRSRQVCLFVRVQNKRGAIAMRTAMRSVRSRERTVLRAVEICDGGE